MTSDTTVLSPRRLGAFSDDHAGTLAAPVASASFGVRRTFALAYREFALDNEALYGLMFERATPDSIPSGDSRMAGLTTFEMLAERVADWQPDLADPASNAHLVWATMHGPVSIELMHRRWGGLDKS